MTGATPPKRGEELLLARISAAAGRARLGRRCATYGAYVTGSTKRRGIRGLLAFARSALPSAARADPDGRLDLYEHGMTVAVSGWIHVVRYDTTAVFRNTPWHLTLTDADGERITLLHGEAEEWVAEVQRFVTDAQLPLALARLGKGERLRFGDIWLTKEGAWTARVSARWSQVQRIEVRDGTVTIGVAGTRNGPEAAATATPNLFVLRALVEHLRTEGGHP